MRTRIRVAIYDGGQKFCVQTKAFWGWELCRHDEYDGDFCEQLEGQPILFGTYEEACNWAFVTFRNVGLLEI